MTMGSNIRHHETYISTYFNLQTGNSYLQRNQVSRYEALYQLSILSTNIDARNQGGDFLLEQIVKYQKIFHLKMLGNMTHDNIFHAQLMILMLYAKMHPNFYRYQITQDNGISYTV